MAQREQGGNGAEVPMRQGTRGPATRPMDRSLPRSLWGEHPLRRLREEMDSLFDRFFGATERNPGAAGLPSRMWDIDVQEADNEIVVRAEAPGFEPQDFDVHVSGNTLTIQAEHKEEAEDKGKGYHRWEHRFGRFQRSIPLSTAVNADKVDARYHSGVLEIHLPRSEQSSRKRIDVKM